MPPNYYPLHQVDGLNATMMVSVLKRDPLEHDKLKQVLAAWIGSVDLFEDLVVPGHLDSLAHQDENLHKENWWLILALKFSKLEKRSLLESTFR